MVRRIFLVLAVLILLLSLVWSAILISNSIKEKRVSERWAKEFVSLESFPDRFPTRKANQSALELEKLSAQLGIDLAPKNSANRSRPSIAQQKAYKSLSKEIKPLLNKRLIEGISTDFKISDELQKFLATNESKLNEIVEYVLHNEAPLWEIDLTKRYKAPFPNLLGHVTLQHLLNFRASLLFQQYKETEAQKTLEASWKINQDLLQRPETISYLIGIVVLRIQVGNLRQLPAEYATWHSRMIDSKIHNQLWSVMEGEVWAMVKGAKEGVLLDQGNEKRTVINQILAPYVRSMTLDWAEVMLQFITDLKTRDPCSPKKVIKDHNEVKKLFPKWNRVGPAAFNDPGGWWNREARLRLDLELTNKIIQIKDELKKTSSIKNIKALNSEICPGQTWKYLSENDSFSISFSKKVDWSKVDDIPEGTLILPLTYKSQQ
ncbi:hypothetical protein L0244_32640 [bacterium]|nr:hypothetical protein [bacterium]MCI0617746.1 hypothetical protein [bacterium]